MTHNDIVGKDAEITITTKATPPAAQSTGPVATCFEITPGWRICFTPDGSG